jgi:transcriptional regulator with XRE-family HTH domain
MKPLNVEIGKRLKEIRKNLNLPQHQFCQLFDISQSNYSRLERGFVDMNPLVMRILYEQYKVSVEWLIMGTGEKYKKTSSRS